MARGLSEAQIIERLERQTVKAAKLYSERTGADFVEAQRVVNAL